jgi:tetratricopeptide (TPR) repeat protein
MSVIARIEPLVIPTYPVGAPEKNPVFFEKRVYQGSSGRVYPVPFIDKVFDEPVPVTYNSALLENEFVRLVVLPEIGGRIFIGQDKTNDDYDFFYRQDVIKPALVGLAGPWISGGVEFNWPQHHRPGTFMPADVHIEEEADGAFTIWMSEHDPLDRMKGMHGIRLRPGSSRVELRARLYNRTPLVRTFLWWANVAARVHEQYQSFFPPDVHYVADHAVRAMSSFPVAENPYYGIDYHKRPGANDLSWYKNIPVPTSYMICQTNFDFFGGYDFSKNGGFVHVANRHIAPGKKQWTWGDAPFGYAWDRELTDEGGPYVELMAGVYTDNQPDFTYLLPYETKTFSQSWWPIRDIGPVQQANERAALALAIREDRRIILGLCVSERIEGELTLTRNRDVIARFPIALDPAGSFMNSETVFPGEEEHELLAEFRDSSGSLVLAFRPANSGATVPERSVATEPPAPDEIPSNDELFLIGEHLDQYRHPTRAPEPYWEAALRRDPGDARCHTALGKRALQRGEFTKARAHFEAAVTRLTRRHPNPVTGEAHYHLGLVLRFLGETEPAYRAFYKATWNYEWRACAYYELAALDCQNHDWRNAIEHLDASLATNRDHNKARTLQALVLRRLDRADESAKVLDALLATDPLDHWAAHVRDGGIPRASRNDAQTILDLAFDFADAGFTDEALALLDAHHDVPVETTAVPNPLERSPMTHYLRARLSGNSADLAAARACDADHFFPSRLGEMLVLEWALAQPGADPLAAYGLGNLFFDRRRHTDAIAVWETAVSTGTTIAQVHRNLGIAIWNHSRDAERAAACYAKAMELDSGDARLVVEADQLAKKQNRPPAERLAFLSGHRELVLQRDDATVELAALLNLTGEPRQALDLLLSRRFHPWEGGEGTVLRQYTAARIALGRQALERGDAAAAHREFLLAMDTPESLGEAYHPLQAKADVNYWIGSSLRKLGRVSEADAAFEASASEDGDFTEMAVSAHSPLSYFRGLSLKALGRGDEADGVFRDMIDHAHAMLAEPAKIDYFATSLPNLLVFDENLQDRRDADAHLLVALACHGLGRLDEAAAAIEKVLAFDAAEPRAVELQSQLQVTTPA